MSILRKYFAQKNPNNDLQSISTSHLIELRDVAKEFKTPAGNFRALDGVDLQVGSGEFLAVIGKSGSGKSTLTNMITGIDRPTSGQVIVNGTDLLNQNEGRIAVWRGTSIGVVFQFFQLLPTLTIVENVMLPMDFSNLYAKNERRERALELLERVDMGDQADKLPTEISGGQQQRVAIARSLANDPPIIVADEPTGNLDSKTADAVFSLFESLVDGGKTILMVTHDDDMASRVSRAVTIADGRIVSDEILKLSVQRVPRPAESRQGNQYSGEQLRDRLTVGEAISSGFNPGRLALGTD